MNYVATKQHGPACEPSYAMVGSDVIPLKAAGSARFESATGEIIHLHGYEVVIWGQESSCNTLLVCVTLRSRCARVGRVDDDSFS